MLMRTLLMMLLSFAMTQGLTAQEISDLSAPADTAAMTEQGDGPFVDWLIDASSLEFLEMPMSQLIAACPGSGMTMESGVLAFEQTPPGGQDPEEVDPFEEEFDTLDDAVGVYPPNTCTELDRRPTTNPGIIAQGYTVMIRCMADCGAIYTVFYNPTTGKYAGAHLSSEQDDL